MVRVIYALVFVVISCTGTPEYPFCKSKNQCQSGEDCYQGRCVSCLESSECGAGKECRNGGCVASACKSNTDCGGVGCVNGTCQPCSLASHCGDQFCHQGECVAERPCKLDTDCADDEDCLAGLCKKPWAQSSAPNVSCQLPTLYFGFDESSLTQEARQSLADAAMCMESTMENAVVVEGHTDEQGTEEYNIALSEQRASVVKRYLIRLGILESRLNVLPRGETMTTSDSAKDRRAVLDWK